ncbi:MAG: dihydropteroate synthase [Ardenticatenales bacterium]|nr:dihydropteroate synthase [Ardenticatenales bacterium]
MAIGPLQARWGSQTYVMGIINVTPDSFSGDGLLGDEIPLEQVVEQARRFVEEGAHILDVGGESTRPGSQPVTEEEELARVVPAIAAIAREVQVALSVDTYKASVARAALDAGAHLINDVWGFRMDPAMAPLAAERGVPVVLMHNRSRPKDVAQEARLGGRYEGIQYENLLGDVAAELLESVQLARSAGVAREQIILDPGIGFGKSVPQNLELLKRLDELKVLGYPLLLAPSRKSFIGYTLDLPPEERVEGTAATIAIGIARGADIIRVHDVRVMARVAKMTDAITRQHAAYV